MIDITMTATRRPEILHKTLSSFGENLFHHIGMEEFRLVINVDPVGLDIPSEDVINVAKQYFTNVTYRTPTIPNFSHAWTWCWEQTSGEFVFHLEEDWELLRPINFIRMIRVMDQNPNLVHLRLSTWKSEIKLKQWKWLLDYEDGYYKIPEDVQGTIGFCGHPSLNRLDFIKMCLKNTNPYTNIEKQIKWRNKPLWEHLEHCDFGVFQEPNSPAAIRDIGRRWMVDNGFQKKGNREWFTEWEKA